MQQSLRKTHHIHDCQGGKDANDEIENSLQHLEPLMEELLVQDPENCQNPYPPPAIYVAWDLTNL